MVTVKVRQETPGWPDSWGVLLVRDGIEFPLRVFHGSVGVLGAPEAAKRDARNFARRLRRFIR